MTENTLPNDQIILFRGTKRSVGTSKKGEPKERFEFYLDSAQAAVLAKSITENLGCPNGVKLDFHIVKKPSSSGGTFDSTFCFAKAVQERGTMTPAPNGTTADLKVAQPNVTPANVVAGVVSDKTAAAIKKLKTKVA